MSKWKKYLESSSALFIVLTVSSLISFGIASVGYFFDTPTGHVFFFIPPICYGAFLLLRDVLKSDKVNAKEPSILDSTMERLMVWLDRIHSKPLVKIFYYFFPVAAGGLVAFLYARYQDNILKKINPYFAILLFSIMFVHQIAIPTLLGKLWADRFDDKDDRKK